MGRGFGFVRTVSLPQEKAKRYKALCKVKRGLLIRHLR